MKCAECGKTITKVHYIGGKAYGYNCYKKKLAIIYKQWEDERNAEYSAKCFSAMEIFKNKKNDSFHDSIINQWNACKKLTAKQLDCIINGFSVAETINFYKIWFLVANEETKKCISSWLEQVMYKHKIVYKFVHDEEVHKILLVCHPSGIHFLKDIEDSDEDVFFRDNGIWTRKKDENTKKKIYDKSFLEDDQEDEFFRILKVAG